MLELDNKSMQKSSHQKSPHRQILNTETKGKIGICRNWLDTGTCKFDNKCRFRHPAKWATVGICKKFQAGQCKDVKCKYRHVNDGAAAANHTEEDEEEESDNEKNDE
jgi:hypothetical protein